MILLLVTCYLAVGSLAAALEYLAVNAAIKNQGERADVDQAMADLERSVERFPGGMAAALVVTVIAWPMLAIQIIRNVTRG